MDKRTCIIIDDETNSRELLKGLLNRYCPDIELAGMAENARAGIKLVGDTKPDLILLDIEMPDANGFDLLDQIKQTHCHVIFVTGYDQYAIRAIKYGALDYLLKPVNISDLQQAIMRFKNTPAYYPTSLDVFEQHMTSHESKNIILPHKKGKLLIAFADIIALAAVDGYALFHTVSGQRYLATYPLNYYEELLPGNFFRIHKSTIINLDHVKEFGNGRVSKLTMSDDSIFEVAARRKTQFNMLLRKQ